MKTDTQNPNSEYQDGYLMLSVSYNFNEYIVSGNTISELETPQSANGYRITKPFHFKNKAHHRAYYIALALAQKKPISVYKQRMGDIVIARDGPIILTTSECIDIIMFDIPPEIELDYNVKNPAKTTKDAMEYVPSFFDPGVVSLDHKTKPRKLYYLEIKKPAN